MNKIIFNEKTIRISYDSTIKGYFFSAVDFVYALTDTKEDQARKNWNHIKERNSQLSPNWGQLKLEAKDGKKYLTDVLNMESVLELAAIVKYSNISALTQWLNQFNISKKYMLKHKDIDVIEVELDEIGYIADFGKILNFEHLPIGSVIKNTLDKHTIKEWWKGRTIPASRERLKDFLDKFDMHFPQELLEKSFGLSLSDQYWICPIKEDLKWKDINFFQNDFSEDVGNILFGSIDLDDEANINAVSLISPDNTSDGMLKKKWKIINGKRCLIKGGNTFNQEVANEVLASMICDKLGIPYTKYWLEKLDGKYYCACEDFITPDTELVTAWHIKSLIKKDNSISDYDSFIKKCEELEIKDIRLRIDQMLVLDFIIANIDRHYNNFGLIRDVNTLKWLGFVPIYDSGSSMWSNNTTIEINPTSDKIESKPFRKFQNKQIELVRDFSWLDLSKLDGIEKDYKDILDKVLGNDEDSIRRIERLCIALKKRIEILKIIKQNK
jgi:hypothetical protein